jgi:hypothetical protein
MATRSSGRAKVSCNYRDRQGDYACHISVGGQRVCTEYVGRPRSSHLAADSAEAYDDAARAAISFATSDGKLDESDVAWGDRGPVVARGPRRR